MFPSLIVPSFIAGFLTFFAPCTLPLVPGFLGFISGISGNLVNHQKSPSDRKRILINACAYVLGFSLIFILLGSLFGLSGALFRSYKQLLTRIGGIFVIFFGSYILNLFNIAEKLPLGKEKRFNFNKYLAPGNPLSSFIFGVTFAFGWTPCIGPILGSVLLLASTSNTAIEGSILLMTFSLGLAIPFLLTALWITSVTQLIRKSRRVLTLFYSLSGVLLIIIGLFLLLDIFDVWIAFFYRLFSFINYDHLLNYL